MLQQNVNTGTTSQTSYILHTISYKNNFHMPWFAYSNSTKVTKNTA